MRPERNRVSDKWLQLEPKREAVRSSAWLIDVSRGVDLFRVARELNVRGDASRGTRAELRLDRSDLSKFTLHRGQICRTTITLERLALSSRPERVSAFL